MDSDINNDNTFKKPSKRKAIESDSNIENESEEQEQDKGKNTVPQQKQDLDEDETIESLTDLMYALKQVKKAIVLDKRLPESQKPFNSHLKDVQEEFSSYFDEESGNNTQKGLSEVELMLKEEIKSYRKEKQKEKLQENKQLEIEKQQGNKQLDKEKQVVEQQSNLAVEQNNQSLKKQDPLEDIPLEMPSFMDDLD